MVYLALSIASGLFLTAFAATVCWCCYVVVGLCILGTRELCKYLWAEWLVCWRELKGELFMFMWRVTQRRK